MQIESWNVIAMVVDQHVMIGYPYKYNVVLCKKRARLLAFVPLIPSVGLCLLITFLWDASKPCDLYNNIPKWLTSILFAQCVFMLVMTVYIQLLTVRIARKQLRQLQSGPCEVPAETVRRHWAGVITTALLCLMILFSWIGGIVAIFWFLAFGPGKDNSVFSALESSAAYLNLPHGVWLPLIYALRSPELKPIYAKLHRKIAFWRSNRISSEQTQNRVLCCPTRPLA
jgi:hypothetical protein